MRAMGGVLVPHKSFGYLMDHDQNPENVNYDCGITMKNSHGNSIPIRRLSNDVAKIPWGWQYPIQILGKTGQNPI